MRAAVQIVTALVVASALGWLLWRDAGDAGRDRAATPPDRAPEERAAARHLGAAPAPPDLPSSAAPRREPGVPAEVAGDDPTAPAEVADSERPRPRASRAIEPTPPEDRPAPFDGQALEEAGYRPHDVETIRRRWEEARAGVRAAREPRDRGASDVTPKDLKREQREIDSAMREWLGDDDYDAARFATGQDNRVEIWWVREDSTAASVGLQKGDLLIEYEGTPIYTPDEYLERLRADRALGKTEVVVTIERDGGRQSVAVPEGQVGGLRGVRVAPD